MCFFLFVYTYTRSISMMFFFFIFKLSFIDNVRKDLLLGWWFMFDYRYRRWIFFFSHLLIFVRQSWFNTTSEWSSGFKFDDFLLYGTSINHILFEAIRDHPLKIPYQWLFKRNILQPLSSEFYGSLKWKKNVLKKCWIVKCGKFVTFRCILWKYALSAKFEREWMEYWHCGWQMTNFFFFFLQFWEQWIEMDFQYFDFSFFYSSSCEFDEKKNQKKISSSQYFHCFFFLSMYRMLQSDFQLDFYMNSSAW